MSIILKDPRPDARPEWSSDLGLTDGQCPEAECAYYGDMLIAGYPEQWQMELECPKCGAATYEWIGP